MTCSVADIILQLDAVITDRDVSQHFVLEHLVLLVAGAAFLSSARLIRLLLARLLGMAARTITPVRLPSVPRHQTGRASARRTGRTMRSQVGRACMHVDH